MGVYQNVYQDGDHALVTDVLLDVVYANGDLTGTFDPGALPDYPAETFVLVDTVYANGTMTGNRTDALESDVRLGEQYAANGISKTGTWSGETGDPGDTTWIGG